MRASPEVMDSRVDLVLVVSFFDVPLAPSCSSLPLSLENPRCNLSSSLSYLSSASRMTETQTSAESFSRTVVY